MGFIDIFNFKKYFQKDSDSNVARYGHVNALAAETLGAVKNNVYANNADALAGGLVAGDLYSTATGEVRVVV